MKISDRSEAPAVVGESSVSAAAYNVYYILHTYMCTP